MIELPPNSSNTNHSNASASAKGVDAPSSQAIKAAATQAIEAVVVKAAAKNSAGTQQSTLYEILLKAQLPEGQKQPLKALTAPISQITPNDLQQLQNGRPLLIKTLAAFPLPQGAKIEASLSIAKGVVIHNVSPPAKQPLQPAVISALKQLVPQQQGLTQVLANVMALASNKSALESLSPQTQQAIKTLQKALPELNQLATEKGVKSAINNSGVQLEAKIKQWIQSAAPQTVPAEPALKNKSPSTGENLRNLVSAAFSSKKTTPQNPVVPQQNAPTPNTGKPQSAPAPTKHELQNLVQNDIKHQLNNLRSHLENHGAIKSAITQAQTQVQVQALTQAPVQADTHPLRQDTVALQKALNEKGFASAPANPSSQETKPIHNAIKQYSALTSGTPTGTEPTNKTTAESILLPPLPGQIIVQPQGRQKPNISSKDMADALASVLLKQVKGAIARVSLHQLASQSQRQEATAPQTLSMELPFILNNQAHVIQLRIEEETRHASNSDQQKQKQWVVQMGFDIDGLGPMLCQITLLNQTVSVSFWAEWEHTLHHTQQHFDFLESALNEMGVKVDKIQGHLGIPDADKTTLSNQLVDIKT